MERVAIILNHGKEFRIPGNDYQLLYFTIENQFLYNESRIKSRLDHKVIHLPFQLRVNGNYF
jgi:hypothetical protein